MWTNRQTDRQMDPNAMPSPLARVKTRTAIFDVATSTNMPPPTLLHHQTYLYKIWFWSLQPLSYDGNENLSWTLTFDFLMPPSNQFIFASFCTRIPSLVKIPSLVHKLAWQHFYLTWPLTSWPHSLIGSSLNHYIDTFIKFGQNAITGSEVSAVTAFF